MNTDNSGGRAFSIRLDRKRQTDEVVESNGVKILIDPLNALRISDYELDFQDGREDGFFLNNMQNMQEVKVEPE